MTKRTITFRIDENTLNELKLRSRNKITTLNRFVEEILTDYVDWYAYANKAGFIPFPKALLIKITQQVDLNEIKNMLQQIDHKEFSDMVLFLERNDSQSSFIRGFESWLKASDFVFRKNVSGSTFEYIISHNLGDFGSDMLGTLYSHLLQVGNMKNVRYIPSQNVLRLKFTK